MAWGEWCEVNVEEPGRTCVQRPPPLLGIPDFMPPKTSPEADPAAFKPNWRSGDRFDLFIYLTEAADTEGLWDRVPDWSQTGLKYDWMERVEMGKIKVKPSDCRFAHIVAVRKGITGQKQQVLYNRRDLFNKAGKFYPELEVSIVKGSGAYRLDQLHPVLLQSVPLDERTMTYDPVIYLNDFWILREAYKDVQGDEVLDLNISLSVISLYKFQLMVTFDHAFKVNESLFDADTSGFGLDSVKVALRSTPFWMLALTGLVTVLHAIFDFLAFKNDIQFWRQQKQDMTGLSMGSVLLSAISQAIILLYLWDQTGTSQIILISSLAGLLIEVWKLAKVAFRIRWVKRLHGWILVPVNIQFAPSYETKTREFDNQALRYLSMVAIPLLLGYAGYSAVYESHRSWYAWLLSTLVNFVYTFGFIMMTPQLFINWKLKSVAHIPWRAFIYKALNTIIDDLFAFIIKMPTLHRLACFRDDLIFVIYLYQRWIYPVDKSRPNEFGQTFAAADEAGSDKKND